MAQLSPCQCVGWNRAIPQSTSDTSTLPPNEVGARYTLGMGEAPTCTNDCGRPTPGSEYICPNCGTALTQRLASILDEVIPGPTGPRADLNGARGPIGPERVIPGLASSLDVAITKQARFTQLPGGTPTARPTADDHHTTLAEQPLAFGYAASEARTVLASTLATWAALIAEQRGLVHPVYTLPDLAVFLLDQVPWLRQQPAGADAFDEITTAILNATRTIDRPMDRVYAGPCTGEHSKVRLEDSLVVELSIVRCAGHMYARGDSAVATCDACAREMPLEDARDPLFARIDTMLLTGPEIVTALGGLGSPVNANSIRTWARRGHLTNRAPEGEQPRYRVADVRQLSERSTRTTHREAIPA